MNTNALHKNYYRSSPVSMLPLFDASSDVTLVSFFLTGMEEFLMRQVTKSNETIAGR
jgi:hypothetical protein